MKKLIETIWNVTTVLVLLVGVLWWGVLVSAYTPAISQWKLTNGMWNELLYQSALCSGEVYTAETSSVLTAAMWNKLMYNVGICSQEEAEIESLKDTWCDDTVQIWWYEICRRASQRNSTFAYNPRGTNLSTWIQDGKPWFYKRWDAIKPYPDGPCPSWYGIWSKADWTTIMGYVTDPYDYWYTYVMWSYSDSQLQWTRSNDWSGYAIDDVKHYSNTGYNHYTWTTTIAANNWYRGLSELVRYAPWSSKLQFLGKLSWDSSSDRDWTWNNARCVKKL